MFSSNQPGAANNGLQEHMRITSAGGVSINSDTPMTFNPHMSFSTMFIGSLCNFQSPLRLRYWKLLGGVRSGSNIMITRITITLNSAIDPSCLPANVTVLDTNLNVLGAVTIPGNVNVVDSGALSMNVPAGALLFVDPFAEGGCNVGASAGGDVYMNTQYVMQ